MESFGQVCTLVEYWGPNYNAVMLQPPQLHLVLKNGVIFFLTDWPLKLYEDMKQPLRSYLYPHRTQTHPQTAEF